MHGPGVQARLISEERAQLHIYRLDSHRLALWMDATQLMLPIIKGAILQEMGLGCTLPPEDTIKPSWP